jgi:hypothetical protein
MDHMLGRRIDEEQARWVISRASDLDAARMWKVDYSEGDILGICRELGISTDAALQALAELYERRTVSGPRTLLDRWVGPVEVAAHRTTDRSVRSVENDVVRILRRRHLGPGRRQGPALVFEQRRDAWPDVHRMFGTTHVEVAVIPAERHGDLGAVTVLARLGYARRAHLLLTASLLIGALLMTAMVPLAPAGAAVAAGLAVVGAGGSVLSYRGRLADVEHRLEQLLDDTVESPRRSGRPAG